MMADCDDIIEIKDVSACEEPEFTLARVEKEIQAVSEQIKILTRQKQTLIAKRDHIKDAILQQKSAKTAQEDWNKTDFSWSAELLDKVTSVFKIKCLRPYQLPTMNATMSGNDAILIMPTGGGKSLCFQLPALISKGITLVVSPLISLIEDQVMAMEKYRIETKMLSASSSREEVNYVHTAMTDPKSNLKLLYVTPEKLAKSKRFMSKLQKMHQMGRFARLAIDEVHCCSQWGHDFRPDYKFLGIMRKMFPGTPILGLTATATSRVMQDVQKILNIQGCLVLKASFNRPNLFYEVRTKPTSHDQCVEQLDHLLNGEFKGQSGIIYTMTIKDTEELARDLRARNIRVAPYHGNLEASIRSKIHTRWIKNEYQAVVATIAFGMGIDKPDVRFVIHHCISKSMENFYQESGRAGRDDKPARCIIFWKFSDFSRQSTMVFTEQTGLENLYGMISYCLDSYRCRRKIIAQHFDERWETSDCKNMCDHCSSSFDIKSIDLKIYGNQLLKIARNASSVDQRLTGPKLVDLWLGKGVPKLRVEGAIAKGLDKEKAEKIVSHLIVDGFLREDFHFTPYSTISYIVPGPKAEVGVSPSPLEIGVKRKINPFVKSSLNKNLVTTIDQNNILQNGSDCKLDHVDKTSAGELTGTVSVHSDKKFKQLSILPSKMEHCISDSNSVARRNDEESSNIPVPSKKNIQSPEKKRRRIITLDSSSDNE